MKGGRFLKRVIKKSDYVKHNLKKRNNGSKKKIIYKNNFNLRYKTLIRAKINKKFIFSLVWADFFLKRACKFAELVAYNRGIIFIFMMDSEEVYDFTTNHLEKRNLTILHEKPKPGYVTNKFLRGLKRNYLSPDLVIYLGNKIDEDSDFIKEASALRIPFIAPIQEKVYIDITFPLLISQELYSKTLLSLYKSIINGLYKDKIFFKYAKNN